MKITNISGEPYSGRRGRGERAFTVQPGGTVDVPEALGERLVASGRFTEAALPEVEQAQETAAKVKPAPRRAAARKARGGGTR